MSGINVLRVDASGRYEDSLTRKLVDEFVSKVKTQERVDQVVSRDVAKGVRFVDQDWINSNFTDEAERSESQKEELVSSDALVAELDAADLIVIGTPIYNFGVPAALKAWVDQVARARKTFRYTENGPVGLLQNKRAVVIVTSGGTEVGSAIDFATPYLVHVLGFLGIHDVEIIKADRLMVDAERGINNAKQEIGQYEFKKAS